MGKTVAEALEMTPFQVRLYLMGTEGVERYERWHRLTPERKEDMVTIGEKPVLDHDGKPVLDTDGKPIKTPIRCKVKDMPYWKGGGDKRGR